MLRKSSVIAFIFSLVISAVPVWASPSASMDNDRKIIHALSRITYGIRPGDVQKVKAIGLKRFIDDQLNAASIDDTTVESRLRTIDPLNMTTAELFAKYPNPAMLLAEIEGNGQNNAGDGEMTEADRRARRQKLAEIYAKYDIRPPGQIMPAIIANRVIRAAYSERQLQEVMVDFWQNHFNVFAGKNALRWYIPAYEREVLRKHALGNFRDLLTATARHPAMLFYLDNFESVTPKINERPQAAGRRNMPNNQQQMRRQNRGINENYARELMELHTLGVDGGYTQSDIVEVAKCFTGWTIADPRGYRRGSAAMGREQQTRQLERIQKMQGVPDDLKSGEFYFNERWHESGSKNVLGKKVNEGGIKDGLKVIEMLSEHPATARNIANKLAIKFVSDKPDKGLIDRVAAEFTRSKGDIKSTLRVLFNDREFYASENYRAKIKTPFELAISTVRILDAQTNGGPAFAALLNKLGEVPYGYQAPTGYPDTSADWVNTGALLERLNFVIAVAGNRIPGTRTDISEYSGDGKAATERAIRELLNNEISKETRSAIEAKLKDPLPETKAGKEPFSDQLKFATMLSAGINAGNTPQQQRLRPQSGDPNAVKVVSLILGTPEFQRQ